MIECPLIEQQDIIIEMSSCRVKTCMWYSEDQNGNCGFNLDMKPRQVAEHIGFSYELALKLRKNRIKAIKLAVLLYDYLDYVDTVASKYSMRSRRPGRLLSNLLNIKLFNIPGVRVSKTAVLIGLDQDLYDEYVYERDAPKMPVRRLYELNSKQYKKYHKARNALFKRQ